MGREGAWGGGRGGGNRGGEGGSRGGEGEVVGERKQRGWEETGKGGESTEGREQGTGSGRKWGPLIIIDVHTHRSGHHMHICTLAHAYVYRM